MLQRCCAHSPRGGVVNRCSTGDPILRCGWRCCPRHRCGQRCSRRFPTGRPPGRTSTASPSPQRSSGSWTPRGQARECGCFCSPTGRRWRMCWRSFCRGTPRNCAIPPLSLNSGTGSASTPLRRCDQGMVCFLPALAIPAFPPGWGGRSSLWCRNAGRRTATRGRSAAPPALARRGPQMPRSLRRPSDAVVV
jgi:hypothetical protein